jgi:hypothetical protein
MRSVASAVGSVGNRRQEKAKSGNPEGRPSLGRRDPQRSDSVHTQVKASCNSSPFQPITVVKNRVIGQNCFALHRGKALCGMKSRSATFEEIMDALQSGGVKRVLFSETTNGRQIKTAPANTQAILNSRVVRDSLPIRVFDRLN